MREIVLDTETTGTDPARHRIIEIGCVELIDGLPSGVTRRWYVNPLQKSDYDAWLKHRIADEFLIDKPVFARIADEFLEFIGDAPLVAHNAEFDMDFLNADLLACGRPLIGKSRFIDTMAIARKVRPGKKMDLDSLRRHYDVGIARDAHGALTDALILAQVYIALKGGRQKAMDVDVAIEKKALVLDGMSPAQWTPRLVHPSAEESAAHAAFIATIPNAIWLWSAV